MVELGATFNIRKPNQDIEHLWIVLTSPDPTTFKVIIVNITSKKSYSDMTTELVVGDHPFIIKPSVVYFSDATISDSREIERALNSGLATLNHKCSFEILTKIQTGLLKSPHTPQKVKNAFNNARESNQV